MKRQALHMTKLILFALFTAFVSSISHAQNTFPATGAVGIGTTSPNASSLLEIKSISKGFLAPRMTKAQRDAIGAPAVGLLIYQTNITPGFYYYAGSSWKAVTPAVAGWLLTGNGGTDSSINFLGTTDKHPLVFRVNNKKSGWIDYNSVIGGGSGNTAFGYQALFANTTGSASTAIGYNALLSNTTGLYNTATGHSALFKNTVGTFNTANGYQALYSNTTGNNNTAIGEGALTFNTSGSYNSATGERALNGNINGSGNTANGGYALYANSSGGYNTAIGGFAFRYNSSGSNNTGVGYGVLASNNGNDNTAAGYYAMYENVSGYSNVAIGSGALYNSTNAHNFVAIGDSALYNQSAVVDGGEFPSPGYNTAVGSKALYNNTTGNYNTATGFQSLYANAIGESNTANGYRALYNNVAGRNSALGAFSLYNNGTNASTFFDATANTAIGYTSLYNNTIGYNNNAVGSEALYNNTSGYNNAAFGLQALKNNANGIGNTAVGVAADVTTGSLQNATAIGYFASATASNQVRIGNSNVSSIGGFANWTNISDGRVKKNIKQNVPGLAFINKLNPVTYNLNLEAADKLVQWVLRDNRNEKQSQIPKEDNLARKTKEAVVYTGFIAQEVEKAAKSLNYDFSGVDAAKNDKDLYGLRYAEFVVPLVKAVQELSAKNDGLQKQIDELKSMILSGNKGNLPSEASTSITLSDAKLDQNIPNPFSNTTTISYALPQKFTSAQIIITDKSGKTLKQINISNSGRGSLNIDAATLASGAYNYSLVVDGKTIITKQILLAK